MSDTLWVFGHSFSLPFNLSNENFGWPVLLSEKLNFSLKNFAQPGADNFFVYQSYKFEEKNINKNDIVIIGWSHPSRKTFILDQKNKEHTDAAKNGLIYELGEYIYFRSNNTVSLKNWPVLKPQPRSNSFYDTWFRNYYNDHEQRGNFQAYLDSVNLTCEANYVPFYFSKESVTDVSYKYGAGCMSEFILENNVMLQNDPHLNETGHCMWSEHLYEIIIKQFKN
jgi:hypothetical protein